LGGPALTQDAILISSNDCPRAGDPVNYHNRILTYYGCPTCNEKPYASACDISECSGTYYGTEYQGTMKFCESPSWCP
jgi:hypothetical protein